MTKEVRNLAAIAVIVVLIGILGYFLYNQSSQKPVPADNDLTEALVREDSPVLGPQNAKVTIVEFLDPECESCAEFAPAIKRVMKEFEGNTRLVVRYMPFHRNSRVAASYLEAAGEQGKYWEMMDKMFENQDQWGEIHGPGPHPVRPEPVSLFEKWAAELGLDIEQLTASSKEKKHMEKVDRDFADGRKLGVRGTPTLYVNGRKLLRLDEDSLRSLVAAEMKK
ncbi:MAG TPA: thioredoxin domain-containing protein [Pyrinomonadaceae bacterium]|nr:thioredoxin domain-containing protein [Pyrinomonadaceae bacterium]HMP65448.1 thioredoxin domain-containing protein [Pyrinomonadaceae bacterium]